MLYHIFMTTKENSFFQKVSETIDRNLIKIKNIYIKRSQKSKTKAFLLDIPNKHWDNREEKS